MEKERGEVSEDGVGIFVVLAIFLGRVDFFC